MSDRPFEASAIRRWRPWRTPSGIASWRAARISACPTGELGEDVQAEVVGPVEVLEKEGDGAVAGEAGHEVGQVEHEQPAAAMGVAIGPPVVAEQPLLDPGTGRRARRRRVTPTEPPG
jgi:hypothetical protein